MFYIIDIVAGDGYVGFTGHKLSYYHY